MDRVKKTLHVALSKDSSSEQLMAQIAPLNVCHDLLACLHSSWGLL